MPGGPPWLLTSPPGARAERPVVNVGWRWRGGWHGLAAAVVLGLVAGVVHAQTAPGSPPPRPGAGAATESGRALLDALSQVEAVQRQMRELRGQFEESSNRIDQLGERLQKAEKRHGDLYNDTDGRLRQLEQQARDDAAERKRLSGQLGALELRVQTLKEQIKVHVRELAVELDERMRKLETAATGSASAASAMVAQVAALEARLARLEAVSGAAALADIDARLRRLEAAPAAPAAPAAMGDLPPGSATAPAAGGTPGPRVPAPPAAPPAAQGGAAAAAPASSESVPGRAYDQALKLARTGDFPAALQAFQGFSRQYPRHELAPGAQYWIGDLYARLGDHANAIAAQQRLLDAYPDHLRVPDAMVAMAASRAAAGDPAGARRLLGEVIARHPQTDAAERARQRLARLK